MCNVRLATSYYILMLYFDLRTHSKSGHSACIFSRCEHTLHGGISSFIIIVVHIYYIQIFTDKVAAESFLGQAITYLFGLRNKFIVA